MCLLEATAPAGKLYLIIIRRISMTAVLVDAFFLTREIGVRVARLSLVVPLEGAVLNVRALTLLL